ncbi:hypothetical protein GGS20DRAFT_550577 [Poronia punctata]|nr:hypothetical protein GGS20DRAFT_550577 [Poronia punctata]
MATSALVIFICRYLLPWIPLTCLAYPSLGTVLPARKFPWFGASIIIRYLGRSQAPRPSGCNTSYLRSLLVVPAGCG